MKIFVIVPVNYEYDDNYYNREGFGEPIAAYRTLGAAAEQHYLLNKAEREKGGMQSEYNTPITEFFVIKELDVPEGEVGK